MKMSRHYYGLQRWTLLSGWVLSVDPESRLARVNQMSRERDRLGQRT